MYAENEKLQAVIAALQQLQKGEVASYGEIARRAGLPGAARYVAYVLKTCSGSHHLPWHRVVNARHHIAFSEHDPRFTEQSSRLTAEGCQIKGRRVTFQNKTIDK